MVNRYLVPIVAAVAILAAGPDLSFDTVQAQTLALEEIVVTARKREERLQDIPLSITAFTADQIDRAGFKTLEDIAMQTPGMQFNTDQAGSRPGRLFANIRIRGIEGSEFATLQTASLFVDGIFALQAAQSLSLMDLERVEVIKGPQSAQFARNSFAGAINYITSNPSLDEWSGKFQAEAGTHENHELQASIEGPIFENTLAFRLGVRTWKKGSQYTASDGGDQGEQTTEAISGMLYARPAENWTLKLRGFYQEDKDGAEANGFLQGRLNDTCTGTTVPGFDTDFNPITRSPTGFFCGVIPALGQPGAPAVDSNTSLFPQILAAQGNGSFLLDNLLNRQQFTNNGLDKSFPNLDGFGISRQMIRLSLVSEYEFDNGASIIATASYNDNDAGNFRDWDMTNVEAWYVTNPQSGDDKSFDIRAQSSGENRLRWLVGANYYEQEFLTSSNGGVFVHTCANFGASLFGSAFGERCDNPGLFPVAVDGGDFVEAWGVYGSLSYDIVDQLTLDLEARYQNDKRSDGVGVFSNTEKQFLPRVSLSYKPTEDMNIYGNWSIGKLPGVVNSNIIACSETVFTTTYIDPNTLQPSTASECDQFRARLGDAFGPVTPGQELQQIEFGIKATWFDGRLLTNVAAYHLKWDNQPFNAFVTVFRDDDGDGTPNTNPNFFPVSDAGSSKSRGFELESAFAVSDKWTVNYNLTYNKNKFTEFASGTASNVGVLGGRAGLENVELKGNSATRFPEWSWNLSSTYTDSLTTNWDWYLRGDVLYNGQAPAGLTNLSIIDNWYLVNAKVGIERESLRVEFFVNNVFDEKSWRGGAEFTDFSILDPGPGVIFDFSKLGIILLPQDKRTFGIRTSMRF